VVLVLEDVPNTMRVCGHSLQPDEIKDLNRGRTYLRDVAQRHNCEVFDDVVGAVDYLVSVWKEFGTFSRSVIRRPSKPVIGEP